MQTILIIEDNPETVELMLEKLRSENRNILHARTGKDAKELLLRETPDLLLLDYCLSDLNGSEFIKDIQEKFQSAPPFIIITGAGDEYTAVTMMKMGALDYIIKDRNFFENLSKVVGNTLPKLAIKKQLTESQHALKKSEERFQLAMENMKEGLWDWDLDTGDLYFSPAYSSMLGYPADCGLTKTQLWLDLIHPQDRENVRTAMSQCVLNQSEWIDVIFRMSGEDGNWRWIHRKGAAILRNNNGKAVRIIGTHSDITEQKCMEDILNARLRLMEFASKYSADSLMQRTVDELCLLTDSPIGFFHFVEDNQVTLSLQAWSTKTLEEMCGLEGKGMHYNIDAAGVWVDCVRERAPVIHNDYAALPHKKGMPDGHAPIVRELVLPIIRYEKIVAIIGVGNKPHNYTEQDMKHVSQFVDLAWDILEARRSEKLRVQMSEIIEMSLNEIYLFDATTLRFRYANRGTLRNTQYSIDQIKEMTPLDLIPEYTEKSYRNLIQPLISGVKKLLVFETYHRRADGSQYPVDVHLQLVQDEFGPVFLAFINDITEKKRTQEKLFEAQKMDSIGNLAGGVAHDFNNMLAGIMGFAGLLDSQLTDEKFRSYTGNILNAAVRAAELTEKLLAFGRRGRYMNQAVSLNETVRSTISILSRTIDQRIMIDLEFDDDLHSVDADPSQMTQVIMNLCVNAAEAMHGSGLLLITTRNFESNILFLENQPDARPGAYAILEVTDTGMGMPEETSQRMFEPFFTTKIDGDVQGTGLGMAVVWGVVKNHDGIIEVDSEIGKGTTIRVYLPKGRLTPSDGEDAKELSVPGKGIVLVVDDEEILRSLLREALEALGYEVITASDGHDAVELYEKMHRQIDLVLMDLRMPRKNGADAFREMRMIKPDVRVLISSGYGEEGEASEMVRSGAMGICSKPYTIEKLSEQIARAMERKNGGNTADSMQA